MKPLPAEWRLEPFGAPAVWFFERRTPRRLEPLEAFREHLFCLGVYLDPFSTEKVILGYSWSFF